MYEVGGFIVYCFDRARVRQLAAGYGGLEIHEFEEEPFPRRLFRVTLRKRTARHDNAALEGVRDESSDWQSGS